MAQLLDRLDDAADLIVDIGHVSGPDVDLTQAARAHWLTVEWLPKYAPELNDIEIVWRAMSAARASARRTVRNTS